MQVNETNTDPMSVRLYGPGDITGIDRQQVVRTEPRNLATNFEPNYFPAVEFDRPDFPWLFTPARSAKEDASKLRPWLCLVVVRKQEGVTLRINRTLPLPVLEITAPAQPERELPDLSESWAWAHGQVTAARRDKDAIQDALAGDPALTVSRLLCPRRLDPLTEYLACVVPTFELGRKAGLGLPITPADEKVLQPAWDSGVHPLSSVTLPVYIHWEFRTGTGEDFEVLVRQLVARPIPNEVGKCRIDISQPGFEIIPGLPPGTIVELEGALRILKPQPVDLKSQPVDWPDTIKAQFQNALKPILDAPWQSMTKGDEPLLAPPIYGAWQAARHTVNTLPAAQTWLDQLNLDPRNRAVAALGTKVVQTEQEPLMAAAWQQLGEIQRINQMKRQAQLARAVNGRYHARHFSRFPPETLLKVVAPAQARVVVEATEVNKPRALLSHTIAQSTLPDRAISAPFRRFTRARGPVTTRFPAVGVLPGTAPISMLAKLSTTTIVPAQKKEAGLVTIDQVSDQTQLYLLTIRFSQAIQAFRAVERHLSKFKVATEDDTKKLLAVFPAEEGLDSPDARAFRRATEAHQTYLAGVFRPTSTFLAQHIDLSDIKKILLPSLNPARTITARIRASLNTGDAANQDGDPLEPILEAPNFPQPMYEALRDLSQDLLFPGLEHVPPDTVTLLETNPAFVESFLVGLNAEMSRELLWRGYPTDQRGTYFRQFWDISASTDQKPDIDMINQWGVNALGKNANSSEQLVLLLRGELLRRYPNAVIYAVQAVREADGRLNLRSGANNEQHPLFRGTLKPDVTFLGFKLSQKEAIADPGWFFVIQEQPTEPRFGLDAADFEKDPSSLTTPAATPNALSWHHLASTPEALKALTHASAKTVLPAMGVAQWGKNSAHQAYITLQRSVRIAIHARDMIPKESQ